MTIYSYEHAAFNTVADFPGGAKALGEIVEINGSVLAHKVSLTDTTNHLTVPQMRKIMLATADHRMLHGLARDVEHVCIQNASEAETQTMEMSIAASAKEFGEYLSAISDAMSDGRMTPTELRRVDNELGKLIVAANQLRSVCAAGAKPRRR